MSESSDANGALTRTVTLPEGVDLHARPAGLLVRTAGPLTASVTLRALGREADAKSILQVLALGATGGSAVEVETAGEGASDALDTVAGLLENLS
jgi:phosphotransferase system HPr (HPr) family protein